MKNKKSLKLIALGFVGMVIIISLISVLIKNVDIENQKDSKELLVENKSCEEGTLWTQSYRDNSYEITLICRCIDGNILCENSTPELVESILNSYQESIDYSCNTNRECVVKDVRNCCGDYLKCVNRDFNPNRELVQEFCRISDSMPLCGFQTINSCECIDNVCVGIL